MNEKITVTEFLENLTDLSEEDKIILQRRTGEAFERILMESAWATAQEVREMYEDEPENFPACFIYNCSTSVFFSTPSGSKMKNGNQASCRMIPKSGWVF